MMPADHKAIAESIMLAGAGVSHTINKGDLDHIYDLVVERSERGQKLPSPGLTAVRMDERVMVQFTEYSSIRLEVVFGKKERANGDTNQF